VTSFASPAKAAPNSLNTSPRIDCTGISTDHQNRNNHQPPTSTTTRRQRNGTRTTLLDTFLRDLYQRVMEKYARRRQGGHHLNYRQVAQARRDSPARRPSGQAWDWS
jgi:hypothetical protein